MAAPEQSGQGRGNTTQFSSSVNIVMGQVLSWCVQASAGICWEPFKEGPGQTVAEATPLKPLLHKRQAITSDVHCAGGSGCRMSSHAT